MRVVGDFIAIYVSLYDVENY